MYRFRRVQVFSDVATTIRTSGHGFHCAELAKEVTKAPVVSDLMCGVVPRRASASVYSVDFCHSSGFPDPAPIRMFSVVNPECRGLESCRSTWYLESRSKAVADSGCPKKGRDREDHVSSDCQVALAD